MVDVARLIDHISDDLGVSEQASYPFKTGYLIGIVEELARRSPEVSEYLDTLSKKYNFVN